VSMTAAALRLRAGNTGISDRSPRRGMKLAASLRHQGLKRQIGASRNHLDCRTRF
jgi:hypothetical protein